MPFGDSHSAPAGLSSSFGEPLDSWTLETPGLLRNMVKIDNLVYYAPEVEPVVGRYDLHPFSPTSHFNLPFRLYSAVPENTEPFRARTKADTEDALPALYVIEVLPSVRVYPTTMYRVLRNAATSISLPRLSLDVLQKQNLVGSLLFRNPHLVIHQVPGLMTSLCVTSLGERLHSILTTF